jgi:hypothetical protein
MIGLNCATGPSEMSDPEGFASAVARILRDHCRRGELWPPRDGVATAREV